MREVHANGKEEASYYNPVQTDDDQNPISFGGIVEPQR